MIRIFMVSKHHDNAITQTGSNDEAKASTDNRTDDRIIGRIVSSHCRIRAIADVLGKEQ